MANNLPGYIIKEASILADSGNRIGQASEITIPVLEATMEDFRNAGMVKPRQVRMGYEATRASFKDTSFDPKLFRLFTSVGPAQKLIALGYAESENGREHDVRFDMTCDFTKIDPGSWAIAGKTESTLEQTIHTGTLWIDEQEIWRFTDFDMWFLGVLQNPGRRRALRMG